MSELLKIFVESLKETTRLTMKALVWVVALSVVSILGLGNVTLDQTITEIDYLNQLAERWAAHGTPNLLPLQDGTPEERLQYQRFKELIKDHGIKGLPDVEVAKEVLAQRADQEYQRGAISVFGIQFPWKHLVLARWLALALPYALLAFFLFRQLDLLQRGLAAAKREELTSKVYEACSFSQVFIVPPPLSAKQARLPWQTRLLLRPFLILPAAVFFGAMIYTYAPGKVELATFSNLLNILFAVLFAFLAVGCWRAHQLLWKAWCSWWELARLGDAEAPYLGEHQLDVDVESDTQGFGHRIHLELSRPQAQLQASGTSYFKDPETGNEILCKWQEAQAVEMGDQLIIKYVVHHLGQSIHAQVETNIRHLKKEQGMSGSYFQLLPDIFVAAGKVKPRRGE